MLSLVGNLVHSQKTVSWSCYKNASSSVRNISLLFDLWNLSAKKTLCSCWLDAVLLPRNVSQMPFISGTSVKNMWHPTAWPPRWKVGVMLTSSAAAGRDDASSRGVKTPVRHHTLFSAPQRSCISLLDCSGYFFHFVVSQRPQPLSDLQFCGCPTKGLGSHANSLFYYFRFQHHPTDRFQLHNGTFISAPYPSDPEEARISVTDKNRKNKILRNVTSTKSIFLIDWSS